MKKQDILNQTAILVAGILAGFLIGRISVPAEILTQSGETQSVQIEEKQTQQQNAGRQAANQTDSSLKPKIFETISGVSADDDPYLGLADAPLTIIEFSDYQCLYCKKYASEAFAQIKKDYVDSGKVKYVIRDFPINEHPQAMLAAIVANCANAQNKFWEMHDILFADQDSWSYQNSAVDAFKEFARQINLDENKFASCMENGGFEQEIAKDIADGELYTIGFTPTVFIGDKKIVGAQPYEVFKKVIDSELKTLWQTREM